MLMVSGRDSLVCAAESWLKWQRIYLIFGPMVQLIELRPAIQTNLTKEFGCWSIDFEHRKQPIQNGQNLLYCTQILHWLTKYI